MLSLPLGKVLNFTRPQFLHLINGNNNSTSFMWLRTRPVSTCGDLEQHLAYSECSEVSAFVFCSKGVWASHSPLPSPGSESRGFGFQLQLSI